MLKMQLFGTWLFTSPSPKLTETPDTQRAEEIMGDRSESGGTVRKKPLRILSPSFFNDSNSFLKPQT